MGAESDLQRVGAQATSDIHLGNAALSLAQVFDSTLDICVYQRHIEMLVSDARAFIGDDVDDPEILSQAVRQIIVKRYGYTAEISDDIGLEGTNFARVIENRRGSALALCLLYAHVLEQLGYQIEIVNFPLRPLVRVLQHSQYLNLDPFDGARPVSTNKLRKLLKADQNASPFDLQILDKRMALIELQDQRKLHLLRNNAPEAAIATLEASVLIAPDEARLWRELGVLYARLDQFEPSISALQHFLELPGPDQHRYSASQLLQDMQTRKDTKNS